MRCKISGMLIGATHQHMDRDGQRIEWRRISVHIPGELEANIIKVPTELDDFDERKLYEPVYLIVNLRTLGDRKNPASYEARVVKVCKDERELNDTDLYFDDSDVSGYIVSAMASQRAAAASK